MSTPRRHHFIPQGYLKQFTDPRSANPRLKVLDLVTGASRWTSTKNAGVGRDFYRVDGDDSQQIENELGRLEGLCVPALRLIAAKGAFTSVQLGRTLSFGALQAVRSHGIRKIIEHAVRRDLRDKLAHWVASEENFEAGRAALEEHMGHSPVHGSWAEVREAVHKGQLHLELNQSEVAIETMRHYEFALQRLAERQWSVSVVEPGAGVVVASDNPMPLGGRVKPRDGILLELEFASDTLMLPLSSSCVLIGSSSGSRYPRMLTRSHLAQVNTAVLVAARYVFCGAEQFELVGPDSTIWTSDQLARTLQEDGGGPSIASVG